MTSLVAPTTLDFKEVSLRSRCKCWKTLFASSMNLRVNKLSCLSREPFLKVRLSTVDLLVQTRLDQRIFIFKMLFNFFTNKVSSMRGSTVLSLLLQLVFSGLSLEALAVWPNVFRQDWSLLEFRCSTLRKAPGLSLPIPEHILQGSKLLGLHLGGLWKVLADIAHGWKPRANTLAYLSVDHWQSKKKLNIDTRWWKSA